MPRRKKESPSDKPGGEGLRDNLDRWICNNTRSYPLHPGAGPPLCEGSPPSSWGHVRGICDRNRRNNPQEAAALGNRATLHSPRWMPSNPIRYGEMTGPFRPQPPQRLFAEIGGEALSSLHLLFVRHSHTPQGILSRLMAVWDPDF